MITKTDFDHYHNMDKKGINMFNVMVLYEIYSNDDVDHISEERVLEVANIVKDCYLKDEAGYLLADIVNAVLLNYKDITEQKLSPREILVKFM